MTDNLRYYLALNGGLKVMEGRVRSKKSVSLSTGGHSST